MSRSARSRRSRRRATRGPGSSGSSRTAPSSTGWASTTAGAEAAAPRLRRLRAPRPRTIVGVNIGKSRVVDVADATADYVRSATLLAPARGLPRRQRVLAEHARDCAGCRPSRRSPRCSRRSGTPRAPTPMLVKIAPDLPDEEVEAIARLAVQLGLAGIIATNTTISREGLLTDPDVVAAAGDGRPLRRAAEAPRARGAARRPRRGARRTSASSRSAGSRRPTTCASGWMPAPPSCRATRRSSTAGRSGRVRSTAASPRHPSRADVQPAASAGSAGVRGSARDGHPRHSRECRRSGACSRGASCSARCARVHAAAVEAAAYAGCWPRLTWGLGRRMKRICIERMAAYQPRPFSRLSTPNLLADLLLDAHREDDHVADDEEDEDPEADERPVLEERDRDERRDDHDAPSSA